MAHMVKMYNYKTATAKEIHLDDNLENTIHQETKSPTIVFLHEILYSYLTPEHKKQLGDMLYNDTYSVEDMLNMDVLIVLINKDFDCSMFRELVHAVSPEHTFVKIQ